MRVTPQAEDSARLQKLLGDLYADRISRPEARSAVLDVFLERILCSRVSIWRFDGEGEELTLLCFASKAAGGAFDSSNQERLSRDEYLHYFNRLVDSGICMSVDAMNDPALQPKRVRYLLPNHIVTLLPAAEAGVGRDHAHAGLGGVRDGLRAIDANLAGLIGSVSRQGQR